MRSMPALQEGSKSTLMTSAFYGYNHNTIISDGEMFDMQNMSGDDYPLTATRRKRGITSLDVSGNSPVLLTGIHGRDQLVFIRGADVYWNLDKVTGLSVSTASEFCPKKIVSFGAYVCIWPDKKYFNTADLSDYGSMERIYNINGTNVSLIMSEADGESLDMGRVTAGTTEPVDPAGGDYWIDRSGSKEVLRQFSEALQEWTEIPTPYVKINATGIGSGVKEYDTIELSGLIANSEDANIQEEVSDLNGSMIVYSRGEDFIVVAGLLSEAQNALADNTVNADITIPDMDYVCESNNRLWGCKYGLVGGQVLNEIYATKLGDFRNWKNFMGLSTDSYTASVGTDGPFTGAITQRGYPVFFKENCIHRVSGMTPSTFQIQTTVCRGVQKGCWRSLAVVNENIYYKARSGIMMYDGNMPQEVSAQLGEELYSDARAGVLREKYYISMKDKNNEYIMMYLDTKHGVWWKEDGVQALGFGTVDDELYYIDEENNTLVTVCGSMGTAEESLNWMAEFDLYGVNYVRGSNYDSPVRIRNEKYVSMFKIRMELEQDATVQLYMKYNDGEYEYIGERTGTTLRTFVLPVKPKRCDHVRFKLTGSGGAKIYDISRIMEVGGDG